MIKTTFLLIPLIVQMTCVQYCGAAELLVFLGTYTSEASKGIYCSRLDPKTGALSAPQLAVETKSPSFLAVHPNNRWLYAVSEAGGPDGKPSGGVSGFEIDRATGKLTLINQQPSGGTGPCHVALDNKGRCVLVANYGGGSVCALGLDGSGKLQPGEVIQHTGSSIHPRRQTGPHAHHAAVSPDNRYALFCDLGLDKVLIYKLGAEAASLEPNNPPAAMLKPGAGPRHLAFSPNGRFVHVINELDSTVTTFRWEAKKGECSEVQTISTLPAGWQGTNYCAEIVVHPDGYIYGSNRGHDSIVAFRCDKKTGKLTTLGHCSSGGKFPRNIALDPSGDWMLSLNQNSGNIVAMRVNKKSGELSDVVSEVRLASPVCAVFVPAKH